MIFTYFTGLIATDEKLRRNMKIKVSLTAWLVDIALSTTTMQCIFEMRNFLSIRDEACFVFFSERFVSFGAPCKNYLRKLAEEGFSKTSCPEIGEGKAVLVGLH